VAHVASELELAQEVPAAVHTGSTTHAQAKPEHVWRAPHIDDDAW
jgi:hypothetical protein